MNSSLTVLLMTNKTSKNYSSYFTNDNIQDGFRMKIQKKDLLTIKTYGYFKVLLNMEEKIQIIIRIKKLILQKYYSIDLKI